MADVQPLSSPTTNYGWAKPAVGGDNNAWGGMINTDLDGIDTQLYAVQTNLSNSTPAMNGTAAAGTATSFARGDHVHPIDTSRFPVTGGTVTGGIVVQGPAELIRQSITQTTASLSINRANGENVALALNASVTGVTVTGWPASGVTGKVRLVITNGGTNTLVGWPVGTIWPGGTAPVITSGAGKIDIILLMTDNAGATIYGSVVGQDYR